MAGVATCVALAAAEKLTQDAPPGRGRQRRRDASEHDATNPPPKECSR